jgi:signal transduction histidine kinase
MTALTILNVDDDDAARYVKTRDLQLSGFVVLEATTGAEALRIVGEENPSIVLLDMQLPDIDGPHVCAFIKQKWPEILVLMTSATFTSPEHRTIGLDSGADSYLVQPAERIELAAAVNSLIRIRASEDELRALNATLEKRVADRTRELELANARLIAEMEQRERAEAALVQSQKMDAIVQLTGGLAHDFNNLLTAVIGNLDMISRRASEPRLQVLAANALKAARRGARLTSQMLAFSRSQKLTAEPVNVNALISGMQDLLAQTIGLNVVVKLETEENLPPALADYNQLELAILNLCLNSRDAMPNGGTITISSRLENKRRIAISVADTGCGMSPELITRVFDPFFTTKSPGKGTGLGLSQVFGVVHQLGGDVSIESEVGKGTTVKLVLPRSDREEKKEIVAEFGSDTGRNERILIVDDDDDVRAIIAKVLSDIGYAVKDVSSGEDALASLTDFDPALVILDFAMPGMTGARVAQEARRRHEHLPILFVSGYADDEALRDAGVGVPILRKPFNPSQLVAAVQSAFSAQGW